MKPDPTPSCPPRRPGSALRGLPAATLAAILALAVLLPATGARARTHVYDDADRLVRTVQPDGTGVAFTYDDADNLVAVTRLTVPLAPSDVVATRLTATTARLAWADHADDETGFVVMRRPASTHRWTVVAELPAGTTSHEDTDLDPNLNYVYRVAALGQNDLASAWSQEAAAAGPGSSPFTIRSIDLNATAGGAPIEIRFDADAAVAYRLEGSTTLAPDSWTPVPFALDPAATPDQTTLTGAAGPVALYAEAPPSLAYYYRLVRQP